MQALVCEQSNFEFNVILLVKYRYTVILLVKYCSSNTVGQILFVKYCWSNTVRQILLVKYCSSNTVGQILFVKYCWSNTVGQNVILLVKYRSSYCKLIKFALFFTSLRYVFFNLLD